MKNSSVDTEKFDSLRAGLRVEDVDFKDAYTPKMIDRQNAYWQRIVDVLDDGVSSDRALCNQLRLRRRQVLSGELRSRYVPGLPRLALGTAACAALFAAAAAWWYPVLEEPGSAVTRTASLEASEPGPAMTQTVSLRSAGIDQADFANNIDFYTWLEGQKDAVADSGGG